jgi:predicted PurR-regulated permease PerM
MDKAPPTADRAGNPDPKVDTRPVLNRRNTRVNQFAIIGILILLAAAILPIVKIFFVPVVVAATLSTLFFPLYLRIRKLVGNRAGLGSILCCLGILLCLLAPTYLVVYLVLQQAFGLYHSIGPVIADIIAKGGSSQAFMHLKSLPVYHKSGLDNVDLTVPIQEGVKTILATGTSALTRTSSGVLALVANVFVMFFTMFYFFRDGEALVTRLKYLVPIREDYEDMIIARFLLISRATIMGTMFLGLLEGSLGAVTLLVFGTKAWVLWGFIMIILATLPFIGTWVVLVPAGLIQIFMDNTWQGCTMIFMGLIVIGNIDNFLRPRIVGRGAKLHDLVVFFSSLGGIVIFGVMGFIVGPVIAALFISVLDIYGMEFERHLKGP